jgi:SNF2 family DNA or RNA helicase
MGLGKTLQSVTFCHVFLENTPATCVLVVVPVNTLTNWVHEFGKWIDRRHAFPVASLDDAGSMTLAQRRAVVERWYTGAKSILIIGYEMFRLLTLPDKEDAPLKMSKVSHELKNFWSCCT